MAIYHGNVDFDLDFDVVASGIVVKPVGMPVHSQPGRVGVRATQASGRDAEGVDRCSIAPPRQAVATTSDEAARGGGEDLGRETVGNRQVDTIINDHDYCVFQSL
jgi:hypothetical protein